MLLGLDELPQFGMLDVHVKAGLASPDCRFLLRLIHAKAPEVATLQEAFRDHAFDISRKLLYHPIALSEATRAALLTEEGERLTVADFSDDTQEAPHYAWPVLRDANYYYADPLTNPDLLEPSYYLNSHRHLLDGILTLRGEAESTAP